MDAARDEGCRVVVLSEYGIVPVREAVDINRALRAAGLLRLRVEMGRELLDPGASRAFSSTPMAPRRLRWPHCHHPGGSGHRTSPPRS